MQTARAGSSIFIFGETLLKRESAAETFLFCVVMSREYAMACVSANVFVSYLSKIPSVLCRCETNLFSEHGANDVAQQEQGDAGNIERRFNGETDG